jgi:hypothetical protein
MTRNLFVACVVSLVLANAGNAQGTVSSQDSGYSYTRSQVKELVRTAHSPEQFKAIASYFGQLQKTYMEQATEAKREWERIGAGVPSNRAKYPTPVDAARNLYENYMYKASEAGALEAKYTRLAAPNPPANAQ